MHDRIARIELPPDEFHKVFEPAARRQLREYFTELGFIQVSLDLAGYRSGSADVGVV